MIDVDVSKDGAAASVSLGTWSLALWLDPAGAAKVGGLAGVCMRAGTVVAGVELLGAAPLQERMGTVKRGLVRAFCRWLGHVDLSRNTDLERQCGDTPIGVHRFLAREVCLHMAPWADVRIYGDEVVVTVPRWLPEASLVELRRRVDERHTYGVTVRVVRRG